MKITTDYKFLSEADYDERKAEPGKQLIARVICYNKPLQEEMTGIFYVEILTEQTVADIKALLVELRKTSHPSAVSFREEIIIKQDESI